MELKSLICAMAMVLGISTSYASNSENPHLLCPHLIDEESFIKFQTAFLKTRKNADGGRHAFMLDNDKREWFMQNDHASTVSRVEQGNKTRLLFVSISPLPSEIIDAKDQTTSKVRCHYQMKLDVNAYLKGPFAEKDTTFDFPFWITTFVKK